MHGGALFGSKSSFVRERSGRVYGGEIQKKGENPAAHVLLPGYSLPYRSSTTTKSGRLTKKEGGRGKKKTLRKKAR